MNGAKVRELREQRGLTQLEVAYGTGITPQTLYSIERGATDNPTIETVRAIARFYGVPIEELLS